MIYKRNIVPSTYYQNAYKKKKEVTKLYSKYRKEEQIFNLKCFTLYDI